MLAKQVHPPSDEEARRLFELARTKTQDGRQSLYGAIADMFERRGDQLDERERELMADILARLSLDVEMSVRAALANRLSTKPGAPADLIRMLANDEIHVAYKILSSSTVLRDSDLVEVVRHRTMQHQLAVAIRRDLSEEVSAALVESGNEDVIVTLLNNQDARISSTVLEYLAEESKRIDAYQKPLVRRPDLPSQLAEKMYAWVSAAVRKYIVENFDVDVHDLDDDLSHSLEEAIVNKPEEEEAAAVRLVEKLHDAGELTSDFVLKSLRQGQISLFELSFAKLTGLRPVLMRRIIYEPGGEALGIACRAIGIDRATFLLIYRLSRRAQVETVTLSKNEVVNLSRFYDQTSREAAFLVLRRWQRDQNFLNALRVTGQE